MKCRHKELGDGRTGGEGVSPVCLFCPLGTKSEARSDQEGPLGDTELVEFLSRRREGKEAVLKKVAVV